MELTRAKRLIALLGAGLVLLIVAGVLVLSALLVVKTRTGADPADAFNEATPIPTSLQGRVEWLDDVADLDRVMEPTTRTALEAAWLLEAATREQSSSHQLHLLRHELRVEFYSLDGQIVRLSATTTATLDVERHPVALTDGYDTILVLTDGRWAVDQLVRTESILTKA